MFSSKRFGALACMFACGLLTCSSSLMADDTWTGTADTDWATAGNWNGGTVPGTGETATIPTNISAGSTNEPLVSGADATVGTIIFTDDGDDAMTIDITDVALTIETAITNNEASGTVVQTINGTDGAVGANDVLNLGDAGNTSGATITVATAGSGVVLGANTTINIVGDDLTVAGAGNVTVNGVMAGAEGVIMNGTGTLTLAAANTFTGGVTASDGTLVLTDAAGLGDAANNLTVTGDVTLNANGLTVANTASVSTGNTLTVTDGGGNTTLSGVITGAGALGFSGTGALTLSGANDFTGGVTVSGAGTVVLGHATALGTGTLTVNENSSYTVGALTVANDVTVATGKTATFTNGGGEAATLSGAIGGAGSMAYTGADGTSSLTLTGTNTFTGTLTVNVGSLIVNGSLADTASVTVADNANATYDLGADDTIGTLDSLGAGFVDLNTNTLTLTDTSNIAGVIQSTGGTGTLVFNAAGETLTLGGTNTFAGGVTVSGAGSTVVVTDAEGFGATASTLDVQADSTYDISTGLNIDNAVNLSVAGQTATVLMGSGETVTLSGVISGAGSLAVNDADGTSTLALTAANTFTGGLTITDGIVATSGAGVLADELDVTIADGELQIGVVDTIDNVTITGAGTLDIDAATTVGALTAGATSTVELADTLTVTDASTIAGTVSGAGNLTFAGAATDTLTLSGTNTFTGDLTATSGTVAVSTALAAGVDVVAAAGATFSNSHDGQSINSLTLTGASNLNLNNSTLTVAGAVDLTDDTVTAHITSADTVAGTNNGDHGCLTLTGAAATFSGTTINVVFDTVLADGDSVMLIDGGAARNVGAGAITDAAILTLTDNSASLDLTYDVANSGTDDVVYTVTRTGYANINTSTSTNVGNVADALDEIVGGTPTGNAQTLITALDNMNAAQQNTAYEQLSPEANAATASVAMAANGAFSGQQMGRTGDIRMAMSGNAPMGPAGPTGAYGQGIGVWGKTFGSWYDQDSRGGFAGFESDTYGIVAGVDYTMENWAFGATFGYASTDVDFDTNNGAETEIDGYNFGLYTTYARDAWYVDGGFTYVYSDIDSKRTVTNIDTITGEYDADTYVWYLGYGYDFECTNALTVTPTIKMAYTYYDQESYDEDGVGGMDMDSFDQDSFTTTLGVNLAYKFTDIVTGNLRMSWEHEYMDNQGVAKGSLYGAEFTTKGLEPDDDTFVIGTGISAQFDEYTSAYLDYDYEFADDADGHNLTLGVRFEF